MYCAECGHPLTPTDHSTAYLRCCHGYGYWHDQPPLPKDAWAERPKVGKFWLYQSPRWPHGLAYQPPKIPTPENPE